MKTKQDRPKFLNLLKIRLPVTGINSIAHRISGALLFLSIPGLIYLFNLSLKNTESFNQMLLLTQGVCFKAILTLMVWATGHHVLSGIRFLLTDIDVGASLVVATRFAWAINVAGALIFLIAGYLIWS